MSENKMKKSSSLHKSKDGNPYYGETESRKALLDRGWKYIWDMPDNEFSQLHNKSETLHFVRLLGLASKKKDRSMRGYKFDDPEQDRYMDSFTTVAVTLVSDEDITVPEIKMELIKKLLTRNNPENDESYFDLKDISYRKVMAGDEFHLSMYEFLFLIIRPEYAGLFEANDDPLGAELRPKTPNAVIVGDDGVATLKTKDGRIKLPTPTIQFYATGIGRTPKTGMIAVDEKGPDGNWVIKPEYKRFAPLVSKTGTVKGDKKKAAAENMQNAMVKNEVDNVQVDIGNNNKNSAHYSAPTLLSIVLQRLILLNERAVIKDEAGLIAQGQAIIDQMYEGRKKSLGSNSGTLHFINELRYKSRRNFESPSGESSGRLEGFTLHSEMEIRVPTITYKLDKTDNVHVMEVSYRLVMPGENFDLTLDEFMYLIIQDEYAGHCEAFGDPCGLYFTPILTGYLEGKSKLPVSRFSYKNPPEKIEWKCISAINGKWLDILPEYKEKFGYLLP